MPGEGLDEAAGVGDRRARIRVDPVDVAGDLPERHLERGDLPIHRLAANCDRFPCAPPTISCSVAL